MIIVLRKDVTQEQIEHITQKVKDLGLKPVVSQGVEKSIIGVIGNESKLRVQPLEAFPGVEAVLAVQTPFKMASRDFSPNNTIINLAKGVEIGGKKITLMAGPCTIETEKRTLEIAQIVKQEGATILRGGAFKPRTSPYSFQGLGEEALIFMERAKRETGLLICTELMDPRDLPLFEKYADIIQIGARNMQNFNLLKDLGKSKKPILLKRGMANTVQDFLMAAEYVISSGNPQVILCERGIRTFETATRFTLDVGAIPAIKHMSHLPVIVDPSHAAGKRHLVPALAKAAIAAGADGIIVEVHNEPEKAVCDGPQALLPETLKTLVKEIRGIAKAIGRDF